LDPLALIFTNVYHSNELLNLLIILGWGSSLMPWNWTLRMSDYFCM
jgi:hypothetical protein